MVDLIERIDALLQQETKLYNDKSDYMSPWFQQNQLSSSTTPRSTAEINEKWREVMCEWCFRVVDHFQLNRETVTIAMYYLDRYLGSHVVDKKKFQLAAMTSLYLANKLYGHRILPMKHLLELSGGSFTKSEMTLMETDILTTCQWHVHPPTAICFVQHLLFLFSASSLPLKMRHELVENARFLTELATLDYYMCLWFTQSGIGLAALLNAMEDSPSIAALPKHVTQDVWRQLATVAPDHLHPYHPHVEAARQRLRLLLACQRKQERQGWDDLSMATRPSPTSPVCVAYLCDVHTD